jgi:hypothetical protein
MADRARIVDDWRRRLRVFDEEFVGLATNWEKDKRRGDGGGPGLFMDALAWRGS